MLETILNMFLLIDTTDQIIIAFMCVICGYILRELLDGTVAGMAGFIGAFFVGSVVMLHLFRAEKILMVGAEEIQVLAASAVGIAATFLFIGVLFRIYGMITDAQIDAMNKSRRAANKTQA